jgi:hypothetical protein
VQRIQALERLTQRQPPAQRVGIHFALRQVAGDGQQPRQHLIHVWAHAAQVSRQQIKLLHGLHQLIERLVAGQHVGGDISQRQLRQPILRQRIAQQNNLGQSGVQILPGSLAGQLFDAPQREPGNLVPVGRGKAGAA